MLAGPEQYENQSTRRLVRKIIRLTVEAGVITGTFLTCRWPISI